MLTKVNLPKEPVDRYTAEFWQLYLGHSVYIDYVRYIYYVNITWEEFTKTPEGNGYMNDRGGAPLIGQWMIFAQSCEKGHFWPVGRVDGWDITKRLEDNKTYYWNRAACVKAAKDYFANKIKEQEQTLKRLKQEARALK